MTRWLLLCVVALAPVFTGCDRPQKAEPPPGKPEKKTEQLGNLTFLRDEGEARARARTENKPLFIDFYADWCVNCKLWAKLAVRDARLNQALQKGVLLKIYDTDAIFSVYQKDARFRELTIGLPFFLVLNPDGSVRYKTQDYRDIDGMVRALSAGG